MDCNGKTSRKMVTDFLDGNGLAGKHLRSANQESVKAAKRCVKFTSRGFSGETPSLLLRFSELEEHCSRF